MGSILGFNIGFNIGFNNGFNIGFNNGFNVGFNWPASVHSLYRVVISASSNYVLGRLDSFIFSGQTDRERERYTGVFIELLRN